MGVERIPWPKLRDYLLRVSTCRSLKECMRAAVVEMQAIIPFDETTGIFNMSDNFNLAGIGKDEACTAAYNNYYRKIRPLTLSRSSTGALSTVSSSRTFSCRTVSTRAVEAPLTDTRPGLP